jgi:hypothetical protein
MQINLFSFDDAKLLLLHHKGYFTHSTCYIHSSVEMWLWLFRLMLSWHQIYWIWQVHHAFFCTFSWWDALCLWCVIWCWWIDDSNAVHEKISMKSEVQANLLWDVRFRKQTKDIPHVIFHRHNLIVSYKLQSYSGRPEQK